MSTDAENNDLQEGAAAETKEKQKLDLQVKVDKPSACERHVTVDVARSDINRYLEEEFNDLVPKAEVPGFRAGRAPRKLVVSRFKDSVQEQVKGKLVVDAMTQITEEQDFSAISEPDMEFDAIQMPEDGPLTFEFTVEVRPEFSIPEWRGLTLETPVATVTDEDVAQHLSKLLARYGKVLERHEPAELGDLLTLNATFRRGAEVLSSITDVTLPLRPNLSLRDAQIEGFGALLAGAKAGEHRTTQVKVSDGAEKEELRGQEVTAEFTVVRVERREIPKLTPSFLEEIGGFVDEADLNGAVREELERQNRYRAQQAIRQQITEQLTRSANWELPPRLLKKQTGRELNRMILELQASGFNDDIIQQYSNQLERNSEVYTAKALKEHFILERLAEDQKLDAEPGDFDREIELIAEQNGIPPRRVRARLEKRGEMDALRNQIVERKVIELITRHALVTEKPLAPERPDDVAALDHAVGGDKNSADIPEAKHSDTAKALPGQPESRG